jgi:hypothetical protein
MPIYQQFNGTATGTAVILDWAVVPFNASFALELQNGTGQFGVQYTLDDPNAAIDGLTTSTTVTWYSDANAGPSNANSTTGNYLFPVRALRVQVSSASNTGTFSMQFAVLQGLPNY